MSITKLKEQVEVLLQAFPDTRDSDITLTIEVWKRYHPKYVRLTSNGSAGIWLSDLHNLPSQESIKRVRAIIQNDEGRFLPTTWAIAKKRKINQDEWLDFIRQQTESRRL